MRRRAASRACSSSAPSTISTSWSPGLKGSHRGGVALIYETLMTQSQDEVSTEYGLLAEAAAYPDDFS